MAVTESAGATIRRITPLGFTDQEAVGWYRNNVQSNWLMTFVPTFVSGIALVLIGTVFANDYLESSLMTSIIMQHLLYVMVGILFAYAAHSMAFSGHSVKLSIVYESVLRRTSLINRHGVLSFVAAGLMIYYWSLPSSLDAALSSNMTQFIMCLSFSCVGVLILEGSMRVSHHALIMLSIAVGKIMGLFGAFLILSPTYLYHAFPAIQQVETGVIMITIMTVIDLAILPCWLYTYFRTPARIQQT